MNTIQKLLSKSRGWAIALAVVAMLALPTFSFALDRIVLKAGNKVIEGTIVKELGDNVFFKYTENGVEKQQRFTKAEILKIERNIEAAKPAETPAAPAAAKPDAPATPAASPTNTETPTAPASTEKKADAANTGSTPTAPATNARKTPKAVVITLGDRVNGEEVGIYFTAHALREALPDLEKVLGNDRSGVVVFRIYSGGGLGLEVDKMWNVIRGDYMKRFRCVAWIESAISAAAMTAHCMEEIYFTSQANYGACTGWHGDLVAVKGAGLQEYLSKMEAVSRRSGYDPLIMRSMQIQQPLSATVMPDGTVKFFPDTTSGDFIVNREHEILTLTAETAKKIHFSKGTADTLEELTKLMGYQELQFVGEDVKGVAWPVCKSERENMDFRKRTKYDEDRTNEYFRQYQTEVNFAASVPREDRPKFVGKARQTLEKFKAMLRNNPAFNLTVFNSEGPEAAKQWLDQQEQLLKDLLR